MDRASAAKEVSDRTHQHKIIITASIYTRADPAEDGYEQADTLREIPEQDGQVQCGGGRKVY